MHIKIQLYKLPFLFSLLYTKFSIVIFFFQLHRNETKISKSTLTYITHINIPPKPGWSRYETNG